MIWIYCSRLVEHGLTSKLPSVRLAGITRVECELVKYALKLQQKGSPIKFCAFNYYYFKEVNKDYLQKSIHYLEQGNYRNRSLLERIWSKGSKIINNVIRQRCNMILHNPFSDGDTILFVGFPNNNIDTEEIRLIKKHIRLNYTFFSHDIIPITHPQYFWGKEIFQDFHKKHFAIADSIYCNSHFVKNEICQYFGKVLEGKKLGVSHLGCEIRPVTGKITLSKPIQKLINDKYILYVSTIEIRKNHQVIYDAYKKLLRQNIADLPKIVFVGRKGWKVDSLFHQLENDPDIRDKIITLNHVSDAELHELYKHCLFTVFPSFIEGYGLAVAESLAFGKFCLASSTAGPFQEIGGDLIDYLDPNDVDAWATQIAFLSAHPEVLAEKEKNIREKHKNVTWEQFAKNLLDPLLAQDKENHAS